MDRAAEGHKEASLTPDACRTKESQQKRGKGKRSDTKREPRQTKIKVVPPVGSEPQQDK